MKQIYILLFFSLLTAGNICAADIYVSSAGDDDTGDGSAGSPYASINHAFSVAASGDVIKIVGTVSTTTSTSISTAENKSITIEGTDETATITGFSGSARLFNLNTTYTGTITLRSLIFLNNTSSNNFGGSVLLNNQTGATVVIDNCTFTGNSTTSSVASNGGGAVAMLNGTLTITNSSFSTNTTAGENGGGAIYIAGTTNSTITGTTFYNNSATNTAANTGRGGAINFNNTGTTTNSITNCTFFENSIAQTGNFHGAAIRVNSGSSSTSVSVSNSLFYNNLTSNGAGTASDFNGSGTPIMSFTNSLGQYGNNIDTTTGSKINNGGAAGMNIGASLSTSSLTWNGTLNKVTFSAPSLLTDDTPIDFGSDNNDVGAWDSQINLFDGSSDADWATGANWSSNAVPTSSENVTLLSDSPAAVISGSTNAVCNDLSVNASSSLTINSGGTLIVSGTSSGNVTYNRTLGTENWYLVASPVSGETYDDAYVAANNLAINGTNNAIATYTTASDSWSYMQTGGGDTFSSGVGYSLRRATGQGSGDIAFTGTINTSDISVAVATGGNGGFNLVGNPFTASINSATLLTDNNANLVSQTLWVWNQASSTYETKVTGDSFIVTPGQGFFIRSSNGTNLSIAESYQTTGGTFQRNNRTELKLFVNDGSLSRFAKVYYVDNATKGFDNGWDGESFGGITSNFDLFTQLLDNNQGKKYQVQSLPNSEHEKMVIPVGVIADAGKQITFTAEAMNLPAGLKVFLEDRQTNTFTRLDEANAKYTVTLDQALNDIGRFYLHTATSVLSTPEATLQNVSLYTINSNTLRVVGLSQAKANVKVFNILGKQVLDRNFASNGVTDLALPRLSTGVYIVQLTSEKGKLNKKIILE